MTELLQTLLSMSVFTFTVSSMLAVGLGYTLQEIVEPLREPTAVLRALVANFVLVPLLAVLITRALPLQPGLEIGVILLGCAAGAPFLIKLTKTARGDIARSATLLVLLVPVTVVFMPFVVPRLAEGANVSTGAIAVQLASTLILPAVLGLVLKAKVPRWADRARPIMGIVSTIALVALFVATLALNVSAILALGFLAFVAAVGLLAGAFAAGYLLARPGHGRRTVLGLGTAQRGIAPATLVASQDIADRDALVMVVLTSVLGMIVLFPLAHRLRKPSASEEETFSDEHLASYGRP